VGSIEFHTQLTSGQNNNKHKLSPKLIKPKFTNLGTSKQGLQNIIQQISWVCLKFNKRFTHTHGRKFTTQPTHTTEITDATTENTPNWLTKEKFTENNFQPLEVVGNHSSTVGRQPATHRKISASPRRPTFLRSPSPILLLPSSSNPKRGSGRHAELKERDGDEK
jgi:hypothetical protein